MWIVICAIFGPIIYLIVSNIVGSISDKLNENKRNKYYKIDEIINVSTCNNNITQNDIMNLFMSQFKLYKKQHYCISYEVYTDKNEQNYVWEVRTTRETLGWGIVYGIRFHFSNGWVYLSFSDRKFNSGGKPSNEYYLFDLDLGTHEIERILGICREESIIKWKMNGMEPYENLPFNYISLLSNTSTSSNNNSYSSSTNSNNSKKQREENTIKTDLLNFYRNLLGLKLKFSSAELKKSYHEAVRKYHPDRYSSSSQRDRINAEMLMKQVNEVYEKLKAVAA